MVSIYGFFVSLRIITTNSVLMNIRLIVAFFILLLAIPVQGQRRRTKKVQRVQKISPEEQMRLERMERMKAAMQKVMIIDSIVVDKDGFLKYYRLSPETGSIKDGDEFFHVVGKGLQRMALSLVYCSRQNLKV